MDHLTLKQLRYFVAAGELNSITKASHKLFVTQPSISAAISQLEQMSGVPLFHRHRAQGVTLTPSGKQLFIHAKAVLLETDNLIKCTQSIGVERQKVLHIAAYPSYAHFFMPPLMNAFKQVHPDIELFCDELDQEAILTGLKNGKYEVAVGYDLAVSPELEFIELSEHPAFAVVGKHHPLADRDQVSLCELSQHAMVLLDWPLSREYFFDLFSSVGATPNIAHRVSSVSMARELIYRGFGFTLFNIPLKDTPNWDYQELKPIPLSDEGLRPLKVGIISVKANPPLHAANALKEIAIDYSRTHKIGRVDPPKSLAREQSIENSDEYSN